MASVDEPSTIDQTAARIAELARMYLTAEDRYHEERFASDWRDYCIARDHALRDLRSACGFDESEDG